MNRDEKQRSFEVLICQQVNLLEDGKPVVMSKRLGKFHTMRDLVEKIPVDVLRYFFSCRGRYKTHLDFDLNLALNESSQNPVYYVQYAHARICSILAEFDSQVNQVSADYSSLSETSRKLFFHLIRYPEEIREIAQNLEVQRIPQLLYDLAGTFTEFYHDKHNQIRNLVNENPPLAAALLQVCHFTKLVLSHGLDLIGVTAPEKM